VRAVRVHAWGEPPRVEEVADPAASGGSSVVRVAAATVGHVDRTIWSGAFLRHPPLPYTPGVEASGVVESGERFAPGQRVWIRGGGLGTATDGTWAERVLVPDAALAPLPDDVGFELGASFFSPCASAWVALHDLGALQPGQRVLVTGATGAVGAIAVQLALDAGAEVLAVVSRPERLALVPPGATGVVGAEGVDADHPVDLLVDTVGGGVLAGVLPHVRPGGRAVLVGYMAGTTVEVDLPSFMQRDVSLHPLNMIRREAQGRAAAPDLLARLAAGRISLEVTPFPMSRAADALAWLTRPEHRGRAVLVPDLEARP